MGLRVVVHEPEHRVLTLRSITPLEPVGLAGGERMTVASWPPAL